MKNLAILGVFIAAPLMAETSTTHIDYQCDRDVSVPADYINADDNSFAVINVEGQQVLLTIDRAASGARYTALTDDTGYIWWTKGPEATLIWQEGEAMTDLLSCMEIIAEN